MTLGVLLTLYLSLYAVNVAQDLPLYRAAFNKEYLICKTYHLLHTARGENLGPAAFTLLSPKSLEPQVYLIGDKSAAPSGQQQVLVVGNHRLKLFRLLGSLNHLNVKLSQNQPIEEVVGLDWLYSDNEFRLVGPSMGDENLSLSLLSGWGSYLNRLPRLFSRFRSSGDLLCGVFLVGPWLWGIFPFLHELVLAGATWFQRVSAQRYRKIAQMMLDDIGSGRAEIVKEDCAGGGFRLFIGLVTYEWEPGSMTLRRDGQLVAWGIKDALVYPTVVEPSTWVFDAKIWGFEQSGTLRPRLYPPSRGKESDQ